MRLTKIYTRTGDEGLTRLADGTQVKKNSLRVSAYGDVDELNSVLGLVNAQGAPSAIHKIIEAVQHILFDMGGELASAGMIIDLIKAEMVSDLESHIDRLNAELQPLEEFILPGGGQCAANLHLARTVCRRAERSVLELSEQEEVSSEIIKYLNRLSDLLFVLARYANHLDGTPEIFWKNPRK